MFTTRSFKRTFLERTECVQHTTSVFDTREWVCFILWPVGIWAIRGLSEHIWRQGSEAPTKSIRVSLERTFTPLRQASRVVIALCGTVVPKTVENSMPADWSFKRTFPGRSGVSDTRKWVCLTS